MNLHRTLLILFAVILPVLALAVILPRTSDDSGAKGIADSQNANESIVLKCYVGDNMFKPMGEIISVFEKRHPRVKFECYYSGTTSLEKMIRENRTGDIFIPGSNSYTDEMKAEGLVLWDAYVCKHIMAAIVLKDGKIKTWEDVLQPGVMVGRGNENVCALGRLAIKVIDRANQPQLVRNIKVISVINYQASSFEMLTSGTVDVLLNWRNISLCPDELKSRMMVIDIPDDINIVMTIPIAVLKYSEHPDHAMAFARFVSSEEGKAIFQAHGFVTKD